jgi:hypothetical protein
MSSAPRLPPISPPTASAFMASLFMERMIRFLLPYFTVITPDLALARAEILQTLASYGARTRSEMLNTVQIIAYGFAGLEMLEEGRAQELSPSMRLRYHGCANNLNRSCHLNEQALSKQLARDLPPAQPHAEPTDNVPDAEAAHILHQAEAAIEARRNSVTPARPAARPQATSASQQTSAVQAAAQQERHNRLWGGAMMDALAGIGMPVQLVAAPDAAPRQPSPAPMTPPTA